MSVGMIAAADAPSDSAGGNVRSDRKTLCGEKSRTYGPVSSDKILQMRRLKKNFLA